MLRSFAKVFAWFESLASTKSFALAEICVICVICGS
jgi:hypothetical protein